MTQSLYWYDLETWGLDPRFFPIAQFGAIRTDLDLNEIEEPLELFCKPPSDMLPQPQAVLTTGITPQEATEKGLPEATFVKRIYEQFIRPGTITTGYNTIRFDDEALRYAFYRNLFDPYEREYGAGRNRWDLIDLLRATRALEPDGLMWPQSEDNNLRLESFTQANGIEHGDAHDAIADVRATIQAARMLKKAQPEMFEYGFSLMNKPVVEQLLDSSELLVHTTGKYKNEFFNTSMIYALGKHPKQKNKYIVYDLRFSPDEFIELNETQLSRRAFSSKEELGATVNRLPVKEIHTGKSPFLIKQSGISNAAEARIQLDARTAKKHAQILDAHPEFKDKVIELFGSRVFEEVHDVDAQLYGGAFPSDADKREMERLRNTNPEQWGRPNFSDNKYMTLAVRLRARNYPELLSEQEKKMWEQFRAKKLLTEDAPWMTYKKLESELLELVQTKELTQEQKFLLQEITLYAQSRYPDQSSS